MKIKLYDDNGKELDIQPITQKLDAKDDICYLISLPVGKEVMNDVNSKYNLCEQLDTLLTDAGVKNTIILPIKSKNEKPIIQKLKVTKDNQ